ncbi:MAG: lysoplasmalogenase [Bacilli bacterium]|nr:lysoplasmalogenase [Bacilli bacterium]
MLKYIPTIVLLGLFAVAAVVHLYFCKTEQEKARKISKPFAMIFLVPAIMLLVPEYPLIWMFPLLSLLGDVFLIFKKKHIGYFVAGSVMFFLGHLCNLIQLTIFLFESDTTIPFIAYFIFAISLVLIIRFIFPLTKRFAGKLALLANVYMPILVFIGIFSLLVTAAYANSYQGLLVTLGYIFFVLSDGLLLYSNFIKDVKRSHFYIMSTYFVGELLITLGLSMLVLWQVVA